MKLESNNLQRNLNEYQTIGRERDRLQVIVADLEVRIRFNFFVQTNSLLFIRTRLNYSGRN